MEHGISGRNPDLTIRQTWWYHLRNCLPSQILLISSIWHTKLCLTVLTCKFRHDNEIQINETARILWHWSKLEPISRTIFRAIASERKASVNRLGNGMNWNAYQRLETVRFWNTLLEVPKALKVSYCKMKEIFPDLHMDGFSCSNSSNSRINNESWGLNNWTKLWKEADEDFKNFEGVKQEKWWKSLSSLAWWRLVTL